MACPIQVVIMSSVEVTPLQVFQFSSLSNSQVPTLPTSLLSHVCMLSMASSKCGSRKQGIQWQQVVFSVVGRWFISWRWLVAVEVALSPFICTKLLFFLSYDSRPHPLSFDSLELKVGWFSWESAGIGLAMTNNN